MPAPDPQLILGNSNSRFSGVTSTMLQVLEHQKDLIPLAVMGEHHLPEDIAHLSFREVAALPRDRVRVFHARRNDEMIQALLLKRIFRQKLKIAFTSTAQRHHSSFTKFLISQMDAVISTCQAAASYLDTKPDIIVPHGIDTELYHPAEDRRAAWQSLGFPGKFGIGIFGRVRPSKGIDILIEAAIPLLEENPDFTIIICGETTPKFQSYQNKLEALVAEHGLSERIRFIGKQPFSRLPELFRSMSITAALSRNEGFGLTVLEAMSSGSAILCSEAGAWKEVVENGTHGFCVPIDEVAATRAALKKLMDNPPALDAMGVAGREHVLKHYTSQREAEQLTEFLKSLMG